MTLTGEQVTTALDVLALVALSAGVGFIYWPASLIVMSLVWLAMSTLTTLLAPRRPPAKPPEQ